MIIIINLELTDKNLQFILNIKKVNHILIVNYKNYINFYSFFYNLLVKKSKDYQIRLSNKNLDSKNTIFLDITSVTNILSMLDYSKGSMLYEYISLMLSDMNEIYYDKIYDFFTEIQIYFKKSDTDITCTIKEDLEKLIYQGIEVSYNTSKILEIFEKILLKYISKNNNKTIIIFLNTEILDIPLAGFENTYIFDVSSKMPCTQYNLIIVEQIQEFDFNLIKEYIQRKYPLSISIENINRYLNIYFKYLIFLNEINVYTEESLIICSILSKQYNKIQLIIPINMSISNITKSYLALL